MGKSTLFSRKQPGGVYTVVDEGLTTGNIYWVDSGKTSTGGDTAGHGDNPDQPFLTLDYAIGQCTANNGDRIYLMPGHSETVTGDGAIKLDVAGVSVIGLGYGTDRPSILLDGSAAVDIEVSAANIYLENVVFKFGHADIVECFDIGAAKNLTVINCEFQENTTNENCKIIFNTAGTANQADGLTIKGCRYVGPDTANTNFVKFNADCDRVTIRDNYISMGINNSTAIFGVASGKDLTNIDCCYNRIFRLNTAGDLIFDGDTSSNTGIVAYNVMRHADTSGEVLVDLSGVGDFENYGTAEADKYGYQVGSADS